MFTRTETCSGYTRTVQEGTDSLGTPYVIATIADETGAEVYRTEGSDYYRVCGLCVRWLCDTLNARGI